jgi:hypothetical protein
MLRSLCLAGALLAGCDDTKLGGPAVTVFLATPDGCARKLSSSDPAEPSAVLYGPDEGMPVKTCLATTPIDPPILAAGFDVLQVLVDYGTHFPASGQVSTPQATLLIDGVATTPVGIPSKARRDDHTFYLGTLPVPSVLTNNLRLSVAVSTGYATDDPTTYTTVAPTIAISTQRVTDDGCQQLSVVTPSPDLGLAPCASTAAAPSILAGIDVVNVVLDYGKLNGATRVLSPTPAVIVDGAQVTTLAVLAQPTTGGHTAFGARVAAPAQLSSNMRIVVPFSSAITITDPTTYALITPSSGLVPFAALSLMRSSNTGCTLLSTTPPSAALGLPSCAMGQGQPIRAGIDQLTLVIDYGALHLPGSTPVPLPTPAVLVDGVASTAALTARQQPAIAGHTYFVATFTAPSALSNNVRIAVPVSTGFALSDPQVYTTVAPAVTVVALVQTADGCFARIAGQPAPDPALALPNLCSAEVTVPAVNVGVDPLQLVIDYGALDLPPAAAPPPPSATLLANGTQIGATLSSFVAVQQPGPTGHSYFTAGFHAPQVIADRVVVAVRAATEATALHRIELPLHAPAATLSVTECPDAGACVVHGATGVVHVRVAIPGDVAQPVALAAGFGDGTPSDPIPPATTSGALGDNHATIPVSVPAARDGTEWRIAGTVGGAQLPMRALVVRRPAITAVLSCPAPCTLPRQTQVGLTVTAPLDIHQPSTTVTATLDGVPILAPGNFDLTRIDNDAHTVSTVIPLTAPNAAGTWELDVAVDGYHQTILVTLQ